MRSATLLLAALLAACAPPSGPMGAASPGAGSPGGGLGGPRAGPPPSLMPDQAASPAEAGGQGCTGVAGRFAALVGGSPDAARAALLAMPGIAAVRVAGSGDVVTQDFRADRATVRARGGRVERVDCG